MNPSSNLSLLKPFCISAYIVRKTTEGPRYLLIRRCGKYLPGTWQMVTGGVELGETAPEAALREIQEETGLEPIEFYSADAVETFYMTARDQITFVPVFVAFVDEMDVRLSPSEHDAYEWLPFEEAQKRLAWAEQQRTLALVHERSVLQKPDDLLMILLPKKPEPNILIRPMNERDIEALVHRFSFPWSSIEKTTEKWQTYHQEQRKNIRTVAVLEMNGQILGYASLLRQSKYPHFADFCEISDLWIDENYRRRGLGRQLIAWLENLCRQEGYPQIGIGVGLYRDYGSAQKLYWRLGYQPDGHGVTYQCRPVIPGEKYTVDDDLIVWLVKNL
jgi:8-oxo-dGTP pyrophosphatase MutT (NUDIX family)/ribosomal protein S18 acetylase RimI-like enzyme